MRNGLISAQISPNVLLIGSRQCIRHLVCTNSFSITLVDIYLLKFFRNSSETSRVEMNRLMQKSSSQQQPSQKIQQMLSLSSIQAQEQQVTSLRELLRQEENRLEMLKKMRSSSPGSKPSKVPSELTQRSAVIRSSETGHHLSNGMLFNSKWFNGVGN